MDGPWGPNPPSLPEKWEESALGGGAGTRRIVFPAHAAAIPGPQLDMVFFIAPVIYWRNNSVYQFDGVAPHMANTSLPVSEHNYDTHAATRLPQALCSTQTPPAAAE